MDRETPHSGESPPQGAVISTAEEEKNVRDRVAIGASLVYEAIRKSASLKARVYPFGRDRTTAD